MIWPMRRFCQKRRLGTWGRIFPENRVYSCLTLVWRNTVRNVMRLSITIFPGSHFAASRLIPCFDRMNPFLRALSFIKRVGAVPGALQMVDSTVIRRHHQAGGEKGVHRARLLAVLEVASRPRFRPKNSVQSWRELGEQSPRPKDGQRQKALSLFISSFLYRPSCRRKSTASWRAAVHRPVRSGVRRSGGACP